MGTCINWLEIGSRVWTEYGFHQHGHDKVNVPPETGGTIIAKWNEFMTMDNPLHRVNWDSGQKSVHYSNELFCIGHSRTITEFMAGILAEAERAKHTVGPNGGDRGFRIFLRNGDWVEGIYQLKQSLEQKNIPIEVEVLPRKPHYRKQKVKW